MSVISAQEVLDCLDVECELWKTVRGHKLVMSDSTVCVIKDLRYRPKLEDGHLFDTTEGMFSVRAIRRGAISGFDLPDLLIEHIRGYGVSNRKKKEIAAEAERMHHAELAARELIARKEANKRRREWEEKQKLEERKRQADLSRRIEEWQHREREAREKEIEGLKARLIDVGTKERDVLARFLSERKVEKIVHFTRIENIPDILEKGIIPRCYLPDRITVNDKMRLDGYVEATCLSLSFPNYRMFYKYRVETGNDDRKWAVLILPVHIILRKPVLFCPTNAARCLRGGKVDSKLGIKGLAAMFSDISNGRDRSELGIEPSFPTDPQAEILCFDEIEPGEISEISVRRPSELTRSMISKYAPNVKLRTDDSFFDKRSDYRFWQENNVQPALNDMNESY